MASPGTEPLIYRVFLALVEDVDDRGTVVAQGGGKVSCLDVPPRALLKDSPRAWVVLRMSKHVERE